jgi:hypothetical protein
MNKKKISEVLEEGVINNLKLGRGIYHACEACGVITQDCDLEGVAVDEERTLALVCPKCYFGCEERADEHKSDAQSSEEATDWDEELPVAEEREEDPREDALTDLANGKW